MGNAIIVYIDCLMLKGLIPEIKPSVINENVLDLGAMLGSVFRWGMILLYTLIF